VIASGAETACYVYGVVPAEAAAPTDEVELVACGGLAAIVGRVRLDEFGEEPLRHNLEDRTWLERAARTHDGVLAAAVGTAPLVPFRFGTVYRSDDGVRTMLRERRAELLDALQRLRGRVELGVKAFLLDAPPGDAPASGREYLLHRQRAQDTHAEALDALRALHERLASLADDSCVNRPQPPELSGRSERMLLNAAYLVRDERRFQFAAAAGEHGHSRVEIVVSGPWPAYNFVDGQIAT
jgi:Gas vesicle synthesis protein GvpL/GvpF